jgi:O-acetyl-ADP-ribose deacetylase (regulator of RNase III)
MTTLTREPLQILSVDAICYGAKDTGEMGGGAAAAILATAGPGILAELQSKSPWPRRVGDITLTESFRLATSGIRWIIHLVSIIKETPQGAYCPEPARLSAGVHAALEAASQKGARSIAFSALGTGEGRVHPLDAANYMMDGLRAFRQSSANPNLAVTFSLPSFRDYEAFHSIVHGHGSRI